MLVPWSPPCAFGIHGAQSRREPSPVKTAPVRRWIGGHRRTITPTGVGRDHAGCRAGQRDGEGHRMCCDTSVCTDAGLHEAADATGACVMARTTAEPSKRRGRASGCSGMRQQLTTVSTQKPRWLLYHGGVQQPPQSQLPGLRASRCARMHRTLEPRAASEIEQPGQATALPSHLPSRSAAFIGEQPQTSADPAGIRPGPGRPSPAPLPRRGRLSVSAATATASSVNPDDSRSWWGVSRGVAAGSWARRGWCRARRACVSCRVCCCGGAASRSVCRV